MTGLIISAILIIAMIVFYPKAWRYVETMPENDEDLTK